MILTNVGTWPRGGYKWPISGIKHILPGYYWIEIFPDHWVVGHLIFQDTRQFFKVPGTMAEYFFKDIISIDDTQIVRLWEEKIPALKQSV